MKLREAGIVLGYTALIWLLSSLLSDDQTHTLIPDGKKEQMSNSEKFRFLYTKEASFGPSDHPHKKVPVCRRYLFVEVLLWTEPC